MGFAKWLLYVFVIVIIYMQYSLIPFFVINWWLHVPKIHKFKSQVVVQRISCLTQPTTGRFSKIIIMILLNLSLLVCLKNWVAPQTISMMRKTVNILLPFYKIAIGIIQVLILKYLFTIQLRKNALNLVLVCLEWGFLYLSVI